MVVPSTIMNGKENPSYMGMMKTVIPSFIPCYLPCFNSVLAVLIA